MHTLCQCAAVPLGIQCPICLLILGRNVGVLLASGTQKADLEQHHVIEQPDYEARCNMMLAMLKFQRSREKDVWPGSRPMSIERSQLPLLTSLPYWVAENNGSARKLCAWKNRRHPL